MRPLNVLLLPTDTGDVSDLANLTVNWVHLETC